jgi:hypothetical protein
MKKDFVYFIAAIITIAVLLWSSGMVADGEKTPMTRSDHRIECRQWDGVHAPPDNASWRLHRCYYWVNGISEKQFLYWQGRP